MAVSDVCGNEYDKAFEVRIGGSTADAEGVSELRDRA
jgi:hypothetical protein